MPTTRYIAFLRGINVSGQKIIKMEQLREIMTLPGFSSVATYIQSGNVLFTTAQQDTGALIAKIEPHLQKSLGYPVSVILRSLPEIQDIIHANPYPQSALPPGDDRKVSVTFLQSLPDPSLVPGLPVSSGTDELTVLGSEVYILYKAYGDTKLTNTLIEKKLAVRATTRNWATVNKVLEL